MATDPYKYFRIEARELLEGLSRGILELEKGLWDKARIGRLLRLAHTLKGASRVVRLARTPSKSSWLRTGKGSVPSPSKG